MNNDSIASGQDRTEAVRGPGWRRRTLRILIGATAALSTIVVLAPTVLSTALGTRLVLYLVNQSIPGTVRAGDLSVGWFSGPWAEDVQLDGPDGDRVLTIDRIEVPSVSLLACIRGSKKVGTVRVINPRGKVRHTHDGSNSLIAAVAWPETVARWRRRIAGRSDQPYKLPNGLQITMEWVRGHMSYQWSAQTRPIELRDLSMSVSLRQAHGVVAQLSSKVRQAKTRGKIEAAVSIRDLFDAHGLLTHGTAEIDAEITVSNLPVAAADRMLGHDGKLSALLGPVLNGQIAARGRFRQPNVTVWTNTQHLKAFVGLDAHEQGLTLDPESVVRLRVVPEAWDVLNKTVDKAVSSKLTQPFNVKVSVKELLSKYDQSGFRASGVKGVVQVNVGDMILDWADTRMGRVAVRGGRGMFTMNGPDRTASVSLQCIVEQGGRPGKLDVTWAAQQVLDDRGRFDASGLQASISGGVTQFPVSLVDGALHTDGLISTVLGPVADATIEVDVNRLGDWQSADGSIAMIFRSRYVTASLKGQLADGHVAVEPQSMLALTVDPSRAPVLLGQLAPLGLPIDGLSLAKPMTANLVVEALAFSASGLRHPRNRLGFRFEVDQLITVGTGRVAGLALSDFSFRLSQDQTDAMMTGVLDARLTHNNQTATVAAQVSLAQPMTAAMTMQGRATIGSLPASMLAGIALGDLSADWPGQRIDKIMLEVESDQDQIATLKGKIVSDWLSAYVGGQYEHAQRRLDLRQGSWVRCQVLPAWLEGLFKPMEGESAARRLAMDHPIKLKAVVGEAQLTFSDHASAAPLVIGPFRFDPNGTKLRVSLAGDGTVLRWGGRDDAVQVKAVQALIKTQNPAQEVDLSLRLGLGPAGPKPQSKTLGQVTCRSKITNLVDATGRIDLAHAVTQSFAKVDGLATGLVDKWIGGHLEDFLGQKTSFRIRARTVADESGLWDLMVKADHGEAQVAATISDPLRLRSSALVRMSVNDHVSRHLLGHLHPFLVDATESTGTIRLALLPEGFAVPVRGWSLSRVRANARLDLGTLQFKRSGLLNVIREALNQDTRRPPVVRFAPLNVSLENGVISYQQMKVQVDDLVLGFHGQVNQINQRVKLLMEIPGPTMVKAFGLPDRLASGYRFQVPIGGTTTEPQLDVAAIVNEGTRLLAARRGRDEPDLAGPAVDQIVDPVPGQQPLLPSGR